MDIALTSRHEKFIKEKVKSGAYGSPAEVIREGLRLLQQEDERHRRIATLAQAVEKGFAESFTRWTKGDPNRVRQMIARRGRGRR